MQKVAHNNVNTNEVKMFDRLINDGVPYSVREQRKERKILGVRIISIQYSPRLG